MWILMAVFIVVFGVLGWFATPNIYRLFRAQYDRKGIEQICQDMFGDIMLTEAITPEVNIVAYDYENRQPRLFSKAAALNGPPEYYNLTFKDAAEGSASAPIYFDPKQYKNMTLVDGGIIANNPAFYSYLFSKHVYN